MKMRFLVRQFHQKDGLLLIQKTFILRKRLNSINGLRSVLMVELWRLLGGVDQEDIIFLTNG